MFEIINVKIYKSLLFRKNSISICCVIKCNNKSNCELYKKNKCIMNVTYSFSVCPYQKTNIIKGYSHKTKKHIEWIRKIEIEYKNLFNLLSCARINENIYDIGDYILLKYEYMSMNNKIDFFKIKNKIKYQSCNFILKKDFTIENIIKICEFIPKTDSFNEITRYKKEIVPNFIINLYEKFPDLFKQLCIKYKKAIEIKENYSHVGRKAYLHTLNAIGYFIYNNDKWYWDGKYLTCIPKERNILFINYNLFEIRTIPCENTIVEITNNNQVNRNTKYE